MDDIDERVIEPIEKKNFIEKTWKFFEGKKTWIGFGILLANAVVSSKFPQYTSPEISKVVEYIGSTIGGIGFLDKARRTDIGQKWQNKLTGRKP